MDTAKKEFDPLNVWTTNNASRIETITPHKVVIIFLIQEFLKVKYEDVEYSPKYRRRFSMLLLKLIQYPDLSYKDLHACLSSPYDGIDPRHLQLIDDLMGTVPTAGVDILFDLQIFIGQLLTDRDNIDVSQFGIVGFYIRRILLALNKMSFPDIIELYKSITVYYEKGARAITILSANQQEPVDATTMGNDSSAMIMEDASAMQESIEPPTPPVSTPLSRLPSAAIAGKEKNGQSKWSVKQANLFIAQQCNLLEHDEIRALRPTELQHRLKEISQDIPFYTQAHILSYMNNLRVRDFFNAMDAFHSAYDRTATRGNTAAKMMGDQPQPANPLNANNKGLQYSSLNLAILHMQFGHQREATASIRESVMLAQEAGDRVCLQLAQTWMFLLDKTYALLCENTVASEMETSTVQAVSLGIQFIINVALVSGKTSIYSE